MNMSALKRCFYITAVVVVASVIASVVIAELTTDTSVRAQSINANETQAAEFYILTCDGDRLVVYKNGMDEPYIETTTALSSLPYEVQKKIREGIEYSAEAQLMAALNEYCS